MLFCRGLCYVLLSGKVLYNYKLPNVTVNTSDVSPQINYSTITVAWHFLLSVSFMISLKHASISMYISHVLFLEPLRSTTCNCSSTSSYSSTYDLRSSCPLTNSDPHMKSVKRFFHFYALLKSTGKLYRSINDVTKK